MLNGLIMRIAAVAAGLWFFGTALIYGFVILGSDAGTALGRLEALAFVVLTVSLLPSVVVLVAAVLLQWILGPVGRWGSEQKRYTYEILDD